MILPGDIVTFPDSDVGAELIADVPPATSAGMLQTDEDAKRLQQLWRLKAFTRPGVMHLVICASATRVMVMHPGGRFILVKNACALVLLAGGPDDP